MTYYETRYMYGARQHPRQVLTKGDKRVKTAKIASLTILSTIIIIATFSSTAHAITGNYATDKTPYVCVVVLFNDTTRTQPIGYCTGILLSPTVVLTAGHSCLGAAAASVCFDKGPISYSLEGGEIVYSTTAPIYDGTPVAYPEYNYSVVTGAIQGSHLFDSSDVGVIILDESVDETTVYSKLPTAGLADTLPQGTYLRVAGYGMQFQVTPKRGGVQESWVGTVSCNTAQVQLLPSNFAGSDRYLKCTANSAKGKGGIAFGDSGGPVLYNTEGGEIVVAINSYANNANCAGVSYHCRIDTTNVLNWINEFLPTPTGN